MDSCSRSAHPAGFGSTPPRTPSGSPACVKVSVEWQQGTLAISQEHFASNLIRGRLLSLARLWGRGSGPLALLACAPGEQHDITLLSFGLLLRSYGWRILFLGADTPIATPTEAAETTRPALTVLRAVIGPPPHGSTLRIARSADVAQLVERRLPKPKVAGSSPVVRFGERPGNPGFPVSGAEPRRLRARLIRCHTVR